MYLQSALGKFLRSVVGPHSVYHNCIMKWPPCDKPFKHRTVQNKHTNQKIRSHQNQTPTHAIWPSTPFYFFLHCDATISIILMLPKKLSQCIQHNLGLPNTCLPLSSAINTLLAHSSQTTPWLSRAILELPWY